MATAVTETIEAVQLQAELLDVVDLLQAPVDENASVSFYIKHTTRILKESSSDYISIEKNNENVDFSFEPL